MNNKGFYHALTINRDACGGCTHCISKCPTGALRIREGKAVIRSEWCVDCGECLKVCPMSAIYIEQDDFQKIFDYKYRAVLVPAIFLGQFPEEYSEKDIFDGLYTLGFTHIFQVEFSVNVIHQEMAAQIADRKNKPAISPFCPAIVRLIQVKYPDLVDNVMNVKSPVEVTAMLNRQWLERQGLPKEETGIFYITPCAAKIASLKGTPEYSSLVDGVLNLDFMFNKVCHIVKNKPKEGLKGGPHPPVLSATEMQWSQTSGEADNFAGRCFAVDEIHNVTEFLEHMDLTGELHDIDFLELRACDRGCVGGVLTPANRFVSAERLDQLAMTHTGETELYNTVDYDILEYLQDNVNTEELEPMGQIMYQGDINEVLRKMNSAKELLGILPGKDCGACGAPGCQSLAEDIVRGEATFNDCIFVQRELERTDRLSGEPIYAKYENAWKSGFFDKDKHKTE